MTPLQARVLTYIEDYITANRAAPTQRGIAEALGLTFTSVHRVVGCLERDGFIERRPGSACNIRLVGADARPGNPAFMAAAVDVARELDAAGAVAAHRLDILLATYRALSPAERRRLTPEAGRTQANQGDEPNGQAP